MARRLHPTLDLIDSGVSICRFKGSLEQRMKQWTDPSIGQMYLLDPSTGNSRPGTQAQPGEQEQRDDDDAHAYERHAHSFGTHVNRQWMNQQKGDHLTLAGNTSASPNWITATLQVRHFRNPIAA